MTQVPSQEFAPMPCKNQLRALLHGDCRAALVYGAKHGGFASLRNMPGLLGCGGDRTCLAASALPGTAGSSGQPPHLDSAGLENLPTRGGAPSAAFGPIGGPPVGPTLFGTGAAVTATYGSGIDVLPGGGKPPTPSPLPPLPPKRSSRCSWISFQKESRAVNTTPLTVLLWWLHQRM